jgi:malonyl-CoA O-methyltransferase
MRGIERLTRLWGGAIEQVAPMEGYARWAPTYPPYPHNPVMAAEAAIVAGMFNAVRPRRALDVGTGTGRNLHLLAASGARLAVGVDLSESMLRHGSGRFPLIRTDALRLPFRAGAFDLVSSSLMCGDIRDLDGWLKEAARVLAAGGHLVYSDFHPSWTAAGWRRTFRSSDGRTCELPLHPHTIEDHLGQLERHGLTIRAIREPRIPKKPNPVVVVLHAVKAAVREL